MFDSNMIIVFPKSQLFFFKKVSTLLLLLSVYTRNTNLWKNAALHVYCAPSTIAFCEFLNFENPLIQSKVMLILLKITIFISKMTNLPSYTTIMHNNIVTTSSVLLAEVILTEFNMQHKLLVQPPLLLCTLRF